MSARGVLSEKQPDPHQCFAALFLIWFYFHFDTTPDGRLLPEGDVELELRTTPRVLPPWMKLMI